MVELYSDGGSQGGRNAGAACILRLDDKVIKIGAALGDATNNEGEIFAGLVGFALMRNLVPERTAVTWVSDSEYTLKSACEYINNWQKNGWRTASKQPVKNQGLWRAYLKLSKPFVIDPSHTRGHSGHAENEACDSAVGEIRANPSWASELPEAGAELEVYDGLSDGVAWRFVSAREQLMEFRHPLPSEEALAAFLDYYASLASG